MTPKQDESNKKQPPSNSQSLIKDVKAHIITTGRITQTITNIKIKSFTKKCAYIIKVYNLYTSYIIVTNKKL